MQSKNILINLTWRENKKNSFSQAEERLKLIEDQMKIDQEKLKLKKKEEKKAKNEQKKILGKDNSRPKLSFALSAAIWVIRELSRRFSG